MVPCSLHGLLGSYQGKIGNWKGQGDLASISSFTEHHSVGSSDKCRMHRCLGIDSSGAPDPKSPSGLAAPIFSFFLSSLEPNSLRMVILTIILVQVLCCHSITKITRNGINGAMFVSAISSSEWSQLGFPQSGNWTDTMC